MATIKFNGEEWVLFKDDWDNPLTFLSYDAARDCAYKMRVDITEDSYL